MSLPSTSSAPVEPPSFFTTFKPSSVAGNSALAICAGLAFHGCGVAASGPLNAPAKAAGLRPAEPARVLIVGSFHFDDAGQDAVKAVHKDVMQPAEQRYIERLAKRLAAFRPTHVLLEFPESAHGRVNAEYQAWREGRAPLGRNEIDQIGWDAADPHGSVRSRPPTNFFLHTEEPRGSGLGASYDSAATNLASYLRGTKGTAAVSYHYTVRQATDGGVTVVDVIDTDLYSWAVLNANVFSINLCFAGSKASWSREQWMTQSKAIDVAAYLAVQDARKYNFSTEVIFPPYGAARAGISDHRYVTKVIGVGNHTDVGGPMAPPWTNFPWDYCKERVDYWLNVDNPAAQPPPVIVVPPAPRVWPRDFTDRELLDYVAAQLGDGDPAWVAKGSTLRDKLWAIAGKVGV